MWLSSVGDGREGGGNEGCVKGAGTWLVVGLVLRAGQELGRSRGPVVSARAIPFK